MARPAILGAIALLVLTAGCLSTLADPPAREDRAEARLEAARTALEEVETYRYEGAARLVATDGAREARATFHIDGAVDVPARAERNTVVTDEWNRSAYRLGERVYRECGAIAVSWGVENRSVEGPWVAATPAGRHLEVLERGSLRVDGSRRFDGRNTTVLAGAPPPGAVERYVAVTPRRLVGGPELRRPRVRVWIDNRTARPVRSVLRFEVEDGDTTASARIRTRYHAFDAPVSIALPAEARDEPWSGPCPGRAR